MPDIVDVQVDELLREAEQRLRGASAPARPMPPVPVKDSAPAAEPPATVSKKQLAVRKPQAQPPREDTKKDTTGPNWFNLPKTDLTPDFKRDWQLLRMRGLLDPKHQKKALRSAPPEYSRVGQVIGGPADFYSARLTRKERKQTIFEEVMGAHDSDKLKGKYAGIQCNKTSGKKAFYQRLVSQRRKRQN
ncbi:rRNA-processing protein fcf2 [Tolypocladium ophioglossoides CBS 100239]|uniref:rRNA-processing protein fcf2 n=1 Tax=Tolypocladium ophioglossoides (strain CBS 100239) TaxID=1163406 RepID=A0A0L0NF08_TOLOC|nr:rRNA-processing protein fcf2 [Tolypocladium ophioglossoides CBS 100239]